MLNKIAIIVFNLCPAFMQHKLIKLEKRFINKFNLYKTLNDNFPSLSFVQIGANDGVSFDGLFNFIKNTRIEKGILIEPISEYFEELKHNYASVKNTICVNNAMHPSLDHITIYRVSKQYMDLLPDWSKGIASIFPEHHTKVGVPTEYIVPEEVKCISIDGLFQKYSPDNNHFNYLQIDTEGFDGEILKMIDFKKIIFDVIKFESINLKADEFKTVTDLLTKYNYTVLNGYDAIAVKKNIKLSII